MFTNVLIVVLVGSTLGCFSWGCWLWLSHVNLEMDIGTLRDEVKRLEIEEKKLRKQRDGYIQELRAERAEYRDKLQHYECEVSRLGSLCDSRETEFEIVRDQLEDELSKTRKLLAESVARENRVRVALNHEGWE
jgi:chromosome segregation ATPase